jgi:hypothetical protein
MKRLAQWRRQAALALVAVMPLTALTALGAGGCTRDRAGVGPAASAQARGAGQTRVEPGAGAPSAGLDGRFDPRLNACIDRERVTFIVTGDTHFGAGADVDRRDLEAVAQMSSMAGQPWPQGLGGTIGEPCGVLVLGDLTDGGAPEQWQSFERAFGLRGGDASLRFPAFETIGNHDGAGGVFVRDRVRERHGSTVYSWTWGKVHVAVLGDGPDDEDLTWLARDLAALPPNHAIVVGLHYPMLGAFSEGQWFGDGNYRSKLWHVLQGHRVLALFHGHYHAAGSYPWHALRSFRPGSAKHSWHTFDVVESDGASIRVACWDYDERRWRYWYTSSSPRGGEAYWADDGIVP